MAFWLLGSFLFSMIKLMMQVGRSETSRLFLIFVVSWTCAGLMRLLEKGHVVTNNQLINGENYHYLQRQTKKNLFNPGNRENKWVKGSLCLIQRPQRLTRTRQTHSTSEVSQPGHPVTQKCASTEFTHSVKSEELCTKINQHGATQRDSAGLTKSYIHLLSVHG